MTWDGYADGYSEESKMGLDTTHDAWSGGYSAFSMWRDALARAAGYEVEKIVEEPSAPGWAGRRTTLIDWGHAEPKNYEGIWDSIPCNIKGPDPLLLLIIHSDCDGHLEPDHCALIADRLTELLPAVDGVNGEVPAWDLRVLTKRFIAGCRRAAESGERMHFK